MDAEQIIQTATTIGIPFGLQICLGRLSRRLSVSALILSWKTSWPLPMEPMREQWPGILISTKTEAPILGCAMSYAETVQQKVVLNLSRSEGRAPAVKIYSIGASGFDEALMSQPDPFIQPQCRLIKSERKIKVGFIPLRIGGMTKTVYIKQHNALSIGHRLASLFLPSAAMRSLRGAVTLLQEGYATAKPVAAVEYRNWGVLIKSLYFSEEVPGAKTVDAFWREELALLRGADGYRQRRAFLRTLAHLLRSLHQTRIYHNDFKASNILILDGQAPVEERFSLIDLQGLRKCFYVSGRRRIKNLAQLDRTLGCLLTRTEKVFFLKAYGGSVLCGQKKNRELINVIRDETKRQRARGRARALLPRRSPTGKEHDC
jgi:tRNA A-37 threonylcarbamoyl transferase component Bud32